MAAYLLMEAVVLQLFSNTWEQLWGPLLLAKGTEKGSMRAGVLDSALLLTSCSSLGLSLAFSGPQFSSCKIGMMGPPISYAVVKLTEENGLKSTL
jgi:hypothetical protein